MNIEILALIAFLPILISGFLFSGTKDTSKNCDATNFFFTVLLAYFIWEYEY